MKKIFLVSALFFLTVSALGQTREIVRCRLWKTKSFCILPNSVNVPETAKYVAGASILRVLCTDLDKQNLVGVWVTIRETSASAFRLKDNFSNVYVVRKGTEDKVFPVAYMNRSKPAGNSEGNPQFLSNKSTFGGECVYELKPSGKYDIFILFEFAEVGDTLVIEGFLEVEIR